MVVVAYACINPYLESPPASDSWGQAVDRVYLDQEYSDHPNSVHKRSQLQQLLQDCQMATCDIVLVRQLADLGESLSEVMDCITALEAMGTTVLTLDQSSYRSPSPLHGAIDRDALMQLATAIQAQLWSRRLQAGHAQNRINVLPPPGRAPYGYRRGRDRYALDRTTAPVVKDFFEQFLLFGSIRGAVRYLEKTYGKRISASTGQRWLTHPVYRGDLLYKDGSIIRDTHTPIIAREEAAQVDRLLRRNRRLPPKTASASRSLAGLVECQECQSRLKVSRVTRPRQPHEYLYLRPINCGQSEKPCKAIPYQAVLDKTISLVCQNLPNAVDTLKAPPVGFIKRGLSAEIAQKEDALSQIPTLLDTGILDEATASLRTYTLRSEISDLKQQISQLPPENLSQIVQTLSIPQFWHDLSESERRVYLREFIRRVLITREGENWGISIEFVF